MILTMRTPGLDRHRGSNVTIRPWGFHGRGELLDQRERARIEHCYERIARCFICSVALDMILLGVESSLRLG